MNLKIPNWNERSRWIKLTLIWINKLDTRNGDGVQGYLRGGGVGVVVRKVMSEKDNI